MTVVAEVARSEIVHTLAENEAVIRRGLTSFVDVGHALREIRDQRQYRDAGYETFEGYCRERWDLGLSTANQQIDAVRVVEAVSARAETSPPQFEFHARPLVKVLNERGEDAVAEVWSAIVEHHDDAERPISGRQISRILSNGANYSGKPGWFELLGEVGDTLIRADKQLSKVETEIRRKPNAAFREKAGEYAAWAEEVAARLRRIEAA